MSYPYFLVILLVAAASAIVTAHDSSIKAPRSWKSTVEAHQCKHIFRPSKRETSRTDQQDPLLLWLGRPSRSLQVKGKHGPLPMPSVWGSFVNLLYITECDDWQNSESVIDFLQVWLRHNPYMESREVYIAGNLGDLQGGQYVLEVAAAMVTLLPHKLAGVVAGNIRQAPVMQFTGNRPFETGNDMTHWTVNRARQSITCNGQYSGVDFLLHDVHLRYTLKHEQDNDDDGDPVDNRHNHFEYELTSVATPDVCFHDVKKWADEWSDRRLPKGTSTDARLGRVEGRLFPRCGVHESVSDSVPPLAVLLSAGIRVVLYNYLQKSSQAICSFYIGIYESDATRFPLGLLGRDSAELETHEDAYDGATLEAMSAVWSADKSGGADIAWVQDGAEEELWGDESGSESRCDGNQHSKPGCGSKGGLIWIQVDDRYVPELVEVASSGGASDSDVQHRLLAPEFGYLTRGTAVEILARLLGKHNPRGSGEVLDFVDLLV